MGGLRDAGGLQFMRAKELCRCFTLPIQEVYDATTHEALREMNFRLVPELAKLFFFISFHFSYIDFSRASKRSSLTFRELGLRNKPVQNPSSPHIV